MNNLFQDPLIEPPNEPGPFFNISHPYGEPPVPSKSLMIYLTSALVAVCYLLASIVCCRCYFKHLKKSSTAPEDLPKLEPPPPLPTDYDRYSDMEEDDRETWKEVWRDISGKNKDDTGRGGARRYTDRGGLGEVKEEEPEMSRQEIEEVMNNLKKANEQAEENKTKGATALTPDRQKDFSEEVLEVVDEVVTPEYRERRGHVQTSL